MKSLFFLFSFAIMTSMTFVNNVSSTDAVHDRITPIPNVEFDIQFIGTTTGTPTLLVNSTPVASSTSPNYWSAYVDGPSNFGIFDFKSNQCYTLKGIGGTQNLCVTISPTYKYGTDAPTIQYNVNTKIFTIVNSGKNCTLKITNSNKICCIFKDTGKPK